MSLLNVRANARAQTTNAKATTSRQKVATNEESKEIDNLPATPEHRSRILQLSDAIEKTERSLSR